MWKLKKQDEVGENHMFLLLAQWDISLIHLFLWYP